MPKSNKENGGGINPWNQIYTDPEKYHYYNLEKPHQDLAKAIDYFKVSGKKVLDLGSGLGRNTLPLIEQGFEVTAVDLSSEAVSRLQEILKKAGHTSPVMKADFRKLPFADQSFDAVMSLQVINHGYETDVKQGISEIERVLRDKGKFFISVPGKTAHGETRYCLVETAQQVEPRTYIPTKGKEIGQPHFMFNEKIIRKFFDQFKIDQIWRDVRDYYCILGEKK